MRKKRRTTDFAQAIEDALYEQRLTQVDAAERIGISPATLGSIMSGHIPLPETVILIAQGLGIDAARLMQLAGYPTGVPLETVDDDAVRLMHAIGELTPAERDALRIIAEVIRNLRLAGNV